MTTATNRSKLLAAMPGIIAVLVLLAAGAAYYWASTAKARIAEQVVRQTLRDPPSAKFRDVREVTAGVCGEVAAKNGFGAMASFTPFYVEFSSAGQRVLIGDTAATTISIMCRV